MTPRANGIKLRVFTYRLHFYGINITGHLNQMKRKKLFYVPGLISLIGLPILIFCFFPKEPKPLTVIRVFLPSDNSPNDGSIKFSRDVVLNTIKSKKIVEVNLNPQFTLNDKGINDSLFKFISEKLEKLIFTSDTTIVIKVNLGNSNTFGQLVWLLNQTLMYQMKRWAYVDNSFYFLHNNFEPPQKDTAVVKYFEL
jgi:hypothetical protein